METETAAADSTRRALLAALAGGLALAAPAPAKGKQGKNGTKGKKPRPPLTVAIARLTEFEARVDSSGKASLVIGAEIEGIDLRPDPPLAIAGFLNFSIAPESAARMQAAVLRALRGDIVSRVDDLAADRVQVLLI